MGRALIIVLDSVGCGGAADAADYGDAGADTLGHIARSLRRGRGDRDGPARRGRCDCPHLDALGLGLAMQASTGRRARRASRCARAAAANGAMASRPRSGKDTPSGHWEIAGTPVDFAWGYFPKTIPAFPPS